MLPVVEHARRSTVVVDSWLLSSGTAVALDRHRARFAASVEEVFGVPRDVSAAQVDRVLDRMPTAGTWFPALVWTEQGLRYLLRRFDPAALRETADLASLHTLDERRAPHVKGPDYVWQTGVRQSANADDQVLVDESGHVTETSFAALALVRDGALVVPRAPRLPSVTLALAVDAAPETGLGVVEAPVRPADLETADAVLLLSALHGVRSVRSIDGRSVRTDDALRRHLQDARERHRTLVAALGGRAGGAG